MPPTPRRPTVISLFTGVGGLDVGFEAAGFDTRVAVEFDPSCVRTLTLNRPEWPLLATDVHSSAATSSLILRAADLRPGEADVLIGGPPCQPFSKSGYWVNGDARRLDDPRADTLDAFLRVLRDTQPAAFLLENVPGLVFDQKDEGLLFLRSSIERINRKIGTSYSFSVALLRAAEFGVPQDRQRVFVIGSREGLTFRFPPPSHYAPRLSLLASGDIAESPSHIGGAAELNPYYSAWDAIGDLEDDDDPALRVTGKWAELLPTIPEGKNYLYHTDRGQGKPLFGWRRRYWNFLLKLAKRLPSWTVSALPGPATGPFHWKNRRLSTRELMRLQTFPDEYRVPGDLRSAQSQIGNATPSLLAESLALEIRR